MPEKAPLICAKCIFNPFGYRIVPESYDIKTTIDFVGELMLLQIELRSFDNFSLFGQGHAFCRVGKLPVAAQANFNKNQRICLLHYQIDFASFAAVIFSANYQPLLLQKSCCTLLSL